MQAKIYGTGKDIDIKFSKYVDVMVDGKNERILKYGNNPSSHLYSNDQLEFIYPIRLADEYCKIFESVVAGASSIACGMDGDLIPVFDEDDTRRIGENADICFEELKERLKTK
jgi:hypothetical protein